MQARIGECNEEREREPGSAMESESENRGAQWRASARINEQERELGSAMERARIGERDEE